MVVHKRERSTIWQCRIRQTTGEWQRATTGESDLTRAIERALALEFEWQQRARLGLPSKQPRFGQIAQRVLAELENATVAGRGKPIYRDYKIVIERYLIPFFGQYPFDSITDRVVTDFDAWRQAQIGREPKASTLRTHASAFNRVIEFAIARGLIPSHLSKPCLNVKGIASQPRPGF